MVLLTITFPYPPNDSYEGMGVQQGGYAQRTTTNNNHNTENEYEEYESRRKAIFQNSQPDSSGTRPPARSEGWPGQQGIGQQRGGGAGQGQGLPRQSDQELPENLGALAGANNAGGVPQGPTAHQGAAGNHPGGQAGIANAPPVRGTRATPPPNEYSGVASALAQLHTTMTDASTARNLRWQRETNGETAKLTTWKVEAMSHQDVNARSVWCS